MRRILLSLMLAAVVSTASAQYGSATTSTDMFGNTNTNYYDSRGYNTGSAKSSTDMFGNTKTDYYDSHGYKTGSSKTSTDMFGNTKTTFSNW